MSPNPKLKPTRSIAVVHELPSKATGNVPVKHRNYAELDIKYNGGVGYQSLLHQLVPSRLCVIEARPKAGSADLRYTRC